MFEQLSIFDVMQRQESNQRDIFSDAFKIFNEHCKHRGWCRPETETEPATWMCGFAGKQLARGWSDWVPCTVENCPLRERK